jgi:hypothetical protein
MLAKVHLEPVELNFPRLVAEVLAQNGEDPESISSGLLTG